MSFNSSKVPAGGLGVPFHRCLGEALLAGISALQPIPACPRALDFENRLDHLQEVLNGVTWYLRDILDDTARNVPGGLNRHQIEGLAFRLCVPGSRDAAAGG